MAVTDYFVHETAVVSPDAKIGSGTKIWHFAQVRENAVVGEDCVISKGAYIDKGVKIGDKCKIQNFVNVYNGVELGDGVFLGPACTTTNDFRPRSGRKGGFAVVKTFIKEGASVGANATIVCGVTLGEYCMVGAGAVVTKNVPPHALVYGNPAEVRGFVCKCGEPLDGGECASCGFVLDAALFDNSASLEEEYAKFEGKTEFDNIQTIGKTEEDFESKPIYAYDKRKRVKTLAKLLEGVPRGKLLDVGCSNGHYYQNFRQLGFSDVTGVDISKERLAEAKKKGYKVVQARAQNLPFPDGHFDVITCIDMLVHVLQPEHQFLAVKEMVRVLKPMGTLVFTVPSRKAYELREKLNSHLFIKHPLAEDARCRLVTLKEAKTWVADSGLELVEVESVFYMYPEAIAAFTPLLGFMDLLFGGRRGFEEYGLIMFLKAVKRRKSG